MTQPTTQPSDDRRVLVAFISEDDELDHVRKAAVELAADQGLRLILYDRDAGSGLSEPRPTWWSAQGEPEQYGDPLSEAELHKLGRPELAGKVAEARAAGVDAWGWLPDKRATSDLIDYAREHGAGLVALPAELDEPGLLDRVRGQTVSDAVERAEEVPDEPEIVLVERDGQVRSRGPGTG